jgi:tetratricopeptide (TPR) repeat protein
VRLELARSLIANRDAQSAVALLDEAASYQKSTVPVVTLRNWALLALGRTAEASQEIEKVLSVSKVPEALVQNAALKLAQKDCAGARASAEEVLHRKPDNVAALSLLVQSYLAEDQVPIALKRARAQASLSPSSARLQQYVGQLLFAHGDRAGARRAFDAALAATPRLAVAELGLAELEVTDGKQDAARKLLTDVVSTHPGYLPGHLYFAQLEMTQGRSAAAVEHYRQAVTLDDTNVIALNGLAYAMAENGQANLALQYAQKAKGIAPDSAAVDDTLGWTYFRMGSYKLAVTNLEEASARQDTALREYHLAMACLKAGDERRGRERLEAALKKNSNLPEAEAARQLFGIAH